MCEGVNVARKSSVTDRLLAAVLLTVVLVLALLVCSCSTSQPNSWTNLKPSGAQPSARYGAALVYLSGSGKLIMFGGAADQENPLNDTWLYDRGANSWTNLKPSEDLPPGRRTMAAAYDPVTNEVVIFGGMGADGVMLNDIWTYDVTRNTWAKLTPASPPSVRFGSKLVYDPSSGKFVLFGGTYLRTNSKGYFQQDFNDIWTFDLAADTWTGLHPSGTAPDGSAATESPVYDEASGKMLVLQGLQPLPVSPPYVPPDKVNKDWYTFAYDPGADSWASSSRPASSPPISQNYALAFDPAARRAILFGGSDPGRGTYGDTWAFDLATNGWTMTLAGGPDSPPGRVDSAMAHDAKTKTMILFGGRSADGENADVPNDTWEYVP